VKFGRGITFLALLTLSIVSSLAGLPPASDVTAATQPNIILILTDDMRADDLVAMPYVRDTVGSAGITFTNAFVTTPICCPSRASILRGQYSHNHGVWSNEPEFRGEPSSFPLFYATGQEDSTIATWLQDAGYRTGAIGKYLNNYPDTAPEGYIPPGWDEWVVQSRGRYFGFDLIENGTLVRYPKADGVYSTDLFAERAVDFVNRAVAREQPFFLFLSPRAPHHIPDVPERHADAFRGEKAPRGPAFNEEDISDKPSHMQDKPRLSQEEIREIDSGYRGRLQTLLSVDEMVAALDEALTESGAIDNTYVIFTSDNGFFLGEHRIPFSKDAPYDESIKVPLIARGPGVPAGRVENRIVLNIDLAPTFAELAGVQPDRFVDGRSLVPLLQGDDDARWRQMALAEFRSLDPNDPFFAPSFNALITEELRYIEYDEGEIELYDIAHDPAEIDNLAAETPSRELRRLSAALAALTDCAAASCRSAEDRSID
jgi:arylsulfatase A-like enzyme